MRLGRFWIKLRERGENWTLTHLIYQYGDNAIQSIQSVTLSWFIFGWIHSRHHNPLLPSLVFRVCAKSRLFTSSDWFLSILLGRRWGWSTQHLSWVWQSFLQCVHRPISFFPLALPTLKCRAVKSWASGFGFKSEVAMATRLVASCRIRAVTPLNVSFLVESNTCALIAS
jgi:hypothetical protein